MLAVSLLVNATTYAGPHKGKDLGTSNNGYYDSSLTNCQTGFAPFQNGENSCVAFTQQVFYIAGTNLSGAYFAYQNNPVDGSSGNYEFFKLPTLIQNGTQIKLLSRRSPTSEPPFARMDEHLRGRLYGRRRSHAADRPCMHSRQYPSESECLFHGIGPRKQCHFHVRLSGSDCPQLDVLHHAWKSDRL